MQPPALARLAARQGPWKIGGARAIRPARTALAPRERTMPQRSGSTSALVLLGALAAAGAGAPRLPAAAPGEAAAGEPALRAPERVEARAEDDRTVSVRWTPSQDAAGIAGYEVVLHGRTLATPRLEVTEGGLAPGRVYCYAVRALDRAGRRSPPAPLACATTPDLSPPSAPGDPRVALRGPTEALVSWGRAEDDVGVAAYELLRDGAPVARVAAAETHAVDAGLAPGAEACWTVRALDAAGNGSPLPPAVCATTPAPGTPAGPGALRASWGRDRDVELGWEPSPARDVVYAVYGPTGKRIGLTSRTRFTVAGFGARGPRCYRVAALDGDGRESPPSAQACAGDGGPAQPDAPSRTAGP